MKLQEEGSNKKPRTSTQKLATTSHQKYFKRPEQVVKLYQTPHQTAYTLQDKKKPNGNEKLATGRRPGNDGKPTHNYRVLERLKIYQNKNLIQLKRLPKSPVPRMGYHQKITPTTQENKKG